MTQIQETESSAPGGASTVSSPQSLISLKIPPPAYMLLAAGLIYLASRGQSARPGWRWLGLPVIGIGLGLDIHALRAFRRHETTVNPFRPEKATQLVGQGAYRYTRNPMYLGMALILSGWSLLRASWSGLLVVPAFIWTLTQVQIIPEEKQLARTFGESYLAYLKQVRRWL